VIPLLLIQQWCLAATGLLQRGANSYSEDMRHPGALTQKDFTMRTLPFTAALLAASSLFALAPAQAEGTVTRAQVSAEYQRALAAGELDYSRQFQLVAQTSPSQGTTSAVTNSDTQSPAPRTSQSDAMAQYHYAMAVGDEDRGRALSQAALAEGKPPEAVSTTTRHAGAPSAYTGTLN